jgi:hypothetical protein
MKPDHIRVKLVSLAAVLLLAALPLAAQKRRSVAHPSAGVAFTATVNGTVLDAVTGQPVAFASVAVGSAKGTTARDGSFELNGSGFGSPVPVVASRSGYNDSTQTIPGSGTYTLTFHLQSRPTVSVRKTDGTTIQLDNDGLKLGYVILFGGYAAGPDDDFCKSDGTAVNIKIADMKRIIGPATTVTQANCCSRQNAQLEHVRLELRSGEIDDVIFKDSCDGYIVDFLGRNHTTGDFTFLKLNEVAEVVFP